MNMDRERRMGGWKAAVVCVMVLAAGVSVFGQKRSKKTVISESPMIKELRSKGPAAIMSEEKRLGAEYDLARKTKYYFILYLGDKKIELKVRGVVLRTWKIDGIRFWGAPEFEGKGGTIVLDKKTTLKAPARTIIKPGQEEAARSTDPSKFDLNTLELDDMPESFELYFNTGLVVKMKAKKAEVGFFKKLAASFEDGVLMPIRRYRQSKKDQTISELEITFDNPNEPKAIYWCFVEGVEGIIR